jgi:hypothetical protein
LDLSKSLSPQSRFSRWTLPSQAPQPVRIHMGSSHPSHQTARVTALRRSPCTAPGPRPRCGEFHDKLIRLNRRQKSDQSTRTVRLDANFRRHLSHEYCFTLSEFTCCPAARHHTVLLHTTMEKEREMFVDKTLWPRSNEKNRELSGMVYVRARVKEPPTGCF